MRTEQAHPIHLDDYRPPAFLVDVVDLDIRLAGDAAEVRANLSIRRNPVAGAHEPLILDGEDLTLAALSLDGAVLPPDRFKLTPGQLIVPTIPEAFTLTVETRLDLAANTRLMGLYRSNGNYCTQCEAEGFRRITYFPDRPDVLSVYTVRVEADAPTILANGNLVEEGAIGDGGRRFAVWHDPFRKPCYLFAIVAGDLDSVSGQFLTRSGRDVALNVFVERGKADLADYALGALKRSMSWDEAAFGREYDLDVFNIVAVSDFNFGAMENKGLNIFNDKYVLASPTTATDIDYAGIEAVIAHEYFHNWSGNRVTCRDWFQLCLKEGFTVFRDQEFTADMRSRAVKRIQDVRGLRSQQFTEDASALAHSVRPRTYSEINNFYTVTVYEKGAELVRMLTTLAGAERARAAFDLYFERCDGTAATVEDFVGAFASVTGQDLGQFMRWYEQAGTPVLTVESRYDENARELGVTFTQSTPATPGQPVKEPFVIPVRMGLLSQTGGVLSARLDDREPAPEHLVIVGAAETSVTFREVTEKPVLSLLRGFSAPVTLRMSRQPNELLVLARNDGDPVNRWDAAQTLATEWLVANARGERPPASALDGLLDVYAAVLNRSEDEPALTALMLTPPAESDIARAIGRDVDPDAVLAARSALLRAVGHEHARMLEQRRDTLTLSGPYEPDAEGAGRRALRNVALDLLVRGVPGRGLPLAQEQFRDASNMTDRIAALSTLVQSGHPAREEALGEFERLFGNDPLIMDKWFTLQATLPEHDVLERIGRLTKHPAFSGENPNRVRALVGAFAAANPSQFHRPDGAGYRFVAGYAREADRRNPQLAARLLTSFRTWRSMTADRREQASAALTWLARENSLSSDLRDIVERMNATESTG